MRFKHSILLLLVALALNVAAQDTRTTATKVADVLALFPAKTSADADRLFQDLLALDDEGLDLVMRQVLPSGNAGGVAARYAVSLLTHHASSADQRSRIENAYLRALNAAKETEVKAYFIDNLKVVGSNASVRILAEKVSDDGLFDQAVSALVSIGTREAGSALQELLERNGNPTATARLIQGLGEMRHTAAASLLAKHVTSQDVTVRRHALWALATIADASSYQTLLDAARSVQFKQDPAEATHALVEYMHRVGEAGNSALVVRASQELLSYTLEADQQHFRLAALKALVQDQPRETTKTLIKELNRFDPLYQREVLKIAASSLQDETVTRQWLKVYRKHSTLQADILAMLANANRHDTFVKQTLLPALRSKNSSVRMTAAEEIAYSKNQEFQPALVDYLLRSSDDAEIEVAKTSLLRMTNAEQAKSLVDHVTSASPGIKVALLEVLADRGVPEAFDVVSQHTASTDPAVRKVSYAALARVCTVAHTRELLTLLTRAGTPEEVKAVQSALIASMDESTHALINEAYASSKARVLPLIPYVNDETALEKVTTAFQNGSAEEKEAAFQALLSWQDHAAARILLSIRRDPVLSSYHPKAFEAFVSQVVGSTLPDDQKLLMLEAAMKEAKTTAEKTAVIRGVGTLRTFLSLVFVSKFLDDEALGRVASRSVMQIALPTADARPGLTGVVVRNTLQRILDKLEGQDSQYEVIDIQTYLASMPLTRGYEPIFNGKDLTGWQGLVENPIARSKMSKAELARKQKEADEKVKENWTVKDGAIYFSGKGDNLCTVRPYGDFEMLVDWKISRDGDSGIYLRGSPQVQIWDPWGKHDYTRVGSGGLYNNKTHPSTPLTVADNPVGEWNTFRIRMVGEHVTVYLNGVLVVDSVVMENYWDRSIPIFPEEAIELQAHGNELAFRNIYVKELGNKPYVLTDAEKKEGFEILFNGKDLDNWVGNKTEYVVEDNAIAIYPVGKGHGNLYTEKEYSDFIFRFEFQLTPGANNGLGIHAPLKGDAAYGGKEIQILDDTAPVYANLQPYQYHGSVYGLVPAKRGYLKPVGEWNQQEVYVKGDHIKVTLNGTVILDADLKKATRNGALDKKEHPGLNIRKGHIGFLGHGTVVRFRNIRIKDLSGASPQQAAR